MGKVDPLARWEEPWVDGVPKPGGTTRFPRRRLVKPDGLLKGQASCSFPSLHYASAPLSIIH